MVWSSINTGGVILTPQFLLCMIVLLIASTEDWSGTGTATSTYSQQQSPLPSQCNTEMSMSECYFRNRSNTSIQEACKTPWLSG